MKSRDMHMIMLIIYKREIENGKLSLQLATQKFGEAFFLFLSISLLSFMLAIFPLVVNSLSLVLCQRQVC